MWEAFLLQMNDFDRYLETELKLLLEPVAALRPPARKGRSDVSAVPQPPRAVAMVAPEPAALAEPLVVVTLPVASAGSL